MTDKTLFLNLGSWKLYRSEALNWSFNKYSGAMMVWGKTLADNPDMSPVPLIADIEVTTICHQGCSWCYKGNTPAGSNMTPELFKEIIDKMPPELTQVAIGADFSATANPNLIEMMMYCRAKDIVPNITVGDLVSSPEARDVGQQLARLCGAVAVSRYADRNVCYDTVKYLTDLGLKQVNIHALLSQETLGRVLETLEDVKTDPRLKGLKAVVILMLKRKGRGEKLTPVSTDDFNQLVLHSMRSNLSLGFDSCAAHRVMRAVRGTEFEKVVETCAEPCESTLFSIYIDTNGFAYPCSFTPETPGWEEGVHVGSFTSIAELWKHPRFEKFRQKLLAGGRNCPLYEV